LSPGQKAGDGCLKGERGAKCGEQFIFWGKKLESTNLVAQRQKKIITLSSGDKRMAGDTFLRGKQNLKGRGPGEGGE